MGLFLIWAVRSVEIEAKNKGQKKYKDKRENSLVSHIKLLYHAYIAQCYACYAHLARSARCASIARIRSAGFVLFCFMNNILINMNTNPSMYSLIMIIFKLLQLC